MHQWWSFVMVLPLVSQRRLGAEEALQDGRQPAGRIARFLPQPRSQWRQEGAGTRRRRRQHPSQRCDERISDGCHCCWRRLCAIAATAATAGIAVAVSKHGLQLHHHSAPATGSVNQARSPVVLVERHRYHHLRQAQCGGGVGDPSAAVVHDCVALSQQRGVADGAVHHDDAARRSGRNDSRCQWRFAINRSG